MILAYILGAVSKLTRLSPSTVDIGISTDTFVPRSLHSFVSSSLRPSLPRSSLVPYIPSSLRLFVPLSLVRPSFPTFLRLFVSSSLRPSLPRSSLVPCTPSSLRLFAPLSLVRPSCPTFLRLVVSSSLSPSFVPRSLHSFVPFQVSGCVLWAGAKCALMTGSTSRSQTTGPVVCTGITATKTTRRVLRGQQRTTTATCLVSTRGRYFRKWFLITYFFILYGSVQS